jgi:hypothetical protein
VVEDPGLLHEGVQGLALDGGFVVHEGELEGARQVHLHLEGEADAGDELLELAGEEALGLELQAFEVARVGEDLGHPLGQAQGAGAGGLGVPFHAGGEGLQVPEQLGQEALGPLEGVPLHNLKSSI